MLIQNSSRSCSHHKPAGIRTATNTVQLLLQTMLFCFHEEGDLRLSFWEWILFGNISFLSFIYKEFSTKSRILLPEIKCNRNVLQQLISPFLISLNDLYNYQSFWTSCHNFTYISRFSLSLVS